MAKIDNDANSNFKIHNEGKNLINKKENENFDSSNNYENNNQKSIFLEKSKKNESTYKINKSNPISSSERSPSMQTKSKNKNIISSKELKSEINIYNNYNNKFNNNTKNNNKNINLTSSFVYYKENKLISNFKKLYGLKQKYISIILLIFSIILFLLSAFDLMIKIRQKKQNFLLCNLIIFVFEMICSSLIILFHIIYYFINKGSNYIIFLIMSILIIVFSLIYITIFMKKQVKLIEIIIHMVYNLFMVITNLIYLYMNYYLVKKNNKVQQNIEDILNFSLRKEKMSNPNKEKNRDHKKKAALVEEDK